MKTNLILIILLLSCGCATTSRVSQGMNPIGRYNFTSTDGGISIHAFFGADCLELIADSVEVNGLIRLISVSQNGQCVVLNDTQIDVKSVYAPEISFKEEKTNGSVMNVFVELNYNTSGKTHTVKYEVYILGDRTLKCRKIG